MEKIPAARRLARLTTLAAAGTAAAALALPALAAADVPRPSANGELAYSDVDLAISTVVPGDPAGPQPQPGADGGVVGQWRNDGAKLAISLNESRIASFDLVDGTTAYPFSGDTDYTDGAAYGPNAAYNQIAYTDDHGLVVKAPPYTRIVSLGTGRPAWSIEGDVYYRKGNTGIWAYDPFSQEDVHVVANATARNPSLSADGTILAYEATVGGNTDVYVIDLAGANLAPEILPGMTLDKEHTPAVSPDGTKVAYAVDGLDTKIVSVTRASGVATTVATTAKITGMAWRPVDKAAAGTVSFSYAGALTPGTILTAGVGQNSGSLPRTDTVGWQRCSAAPANGVADAKCEEAATGSTYTVKNTDGGSYLRAFNRASNAAGDATTFTAAQLVGLPDTQPPAAPTLTEKPDPFIDAQYPQFAWTGAENGGTFECRLNDLNAPPEIAADWAACVSPVKPDALDTGKFRFEVRQVDGAGNEGDAVTHTFEVDLIDPEKPLLTGKPDAVTTDAAAAFTFERTGSEPTTFECRTDGDFGDGPTWVPCTSPFVPSDLVPGYHTFEVRQVDRAGNTSARLTYAWRLDATVAPPTVTKRPDAQTTDTTAIFEFTGESLAQCSVDGGVWGTCTSPLVLKNRKPGEHSLRLRNFTQHGAGGEITTVVWTVLAPAGPVVESPVGDTPPVQQPAAQHPPAETPAPAPAPAAAPAKPAAAATPVAKPATAKAPALVATIGGTKTGPSTGSSATIEVAKESVGVGCSITGTVLRSCKVDLYAPKASGARARAAAAAQVLVGTGTYESKNGSAKMDVRIALNSVGKAMLRRSPAGLKVSVKITGRPVSGAPLKATGVAKLVSDRASLTVGGFAVNSAKLTPASKRRLRALAKFGKAGAIRCVGHTDGSTDDTRYLRTLGADRANAVCGYLAKLGVKAGKRMLVSKADTAPAATNATKAGRAKNRRVQVTIIR